MSRYSRGQAENPATSLFSPQGFTSPGQHGGILTMIGGFQKTDLPPMMQRYVEYKEQYPDALLFFQVGDFYEVFFDDAVTVARALNLTLTSRDKNAAQPIPMCGVPLSVVDAYVDRLLPLGHSVAIVTQTGSGQGVERTLERFVTPGMRLFTTVSSDAAESVILAVSIEAGEVFGGIAYSDPQTGILTVREGLEVPTLVREVGMISPREVVIPRTLAGEKIDRRTSWVRKLEATLGHQRLRFRAEPPGGSSSLPGLTDEAKSSFYSLGTGGKRAVRQLLTYLDEVSLGNSLPIHKVEAGTESGGVQIDAHTRKNLELVANSKDGSTSGTLFGFLNRTGTPGGSRILRSWILHPLTGMGEIERRLDAVHELLPDGENLFSLLEGLSDMERLTARVQLSIASPRDLGAIRDTLTRLPLLQASLEGNTSLLCKEIAIGLTCNPDLRETLRCALVESPPHTTNDGGIVAPGYDDTLDGIQQLRATADEWKSAFEARERTTTGITSLRVKSNNVIGFFIEMPSAHAPKVPAHYTRRQSTATTDRFTTDELREHESAVVSAVDRQVRREQELFVELRELCRAHISELRRVANSLSTLDALVSLSRVAAKEGLVRPQVVAESMLEIESGYHPVVAKLLEGRFVPNSLTFQGTSPTCFLVTGPNMGGKSTFLRQSALVVVMAQMGSFVPARAARVGIVDRVFARLGASDDLHEGDSTFMVEMREAAHILSAATPQSLVLIDELGRGTATSDGLALAQAILEQLVGKIGCRTLFATHYHELTDLEGTLPGVANLSVGSVEEEERVIFTHEITHGPAPKSYGLEVAKLSGLPTDVLSRAAVLLEQESTDRADKTARQTTQPGASLPSAVPTPKRQFALFEREVPRRSDPRAEMVLKTVEGVKPDELTPREALEVLYRLKEIVGVGEKGQVVGE